MNALDIAVTAGGLGMVNALSPGPLLALTLGNSLRDGWKAGIAISAAAVVATLPIIAVALPMHAAVRNPGPLRTAVCIAGALCLGWRALQNARAPLHAAAGSRTGFWQGLTITLLNPFPFVFWATAGIPMAFQLGGDHLGAACFVAAFLVALAGCTLAIAVAVELVAPHIAGRPAQVVKFLLSLAFTAYAVKLLTFAFQP